MSSKSMGELTLSEMQAEHQEWQRRNFPGKTSGVGSFMGMVEELGELAHAMLKHHQGIRGMDQETARERIIDAHCDWIIFSFGLANDLGYDLQEELKRTWAKVKQRDWVANPETGDAISDL